MHHRRMSIPRRTFVKASFAAVAAAVAADGPLASAARRPAVRAVAFDGLAVFDPRPVAVLCEQLFPGKGAELTRLWRARQFEYTWLRTAMGRYADFEQVTQESLAFAAKTLGLELTATGREALMQAFLALRAWPDAPAALASLRDAGYRLALLSNFTPTMLASATRNSKLGDIFEFRLSTDLARAYKPDARAYRLAVEAFRLHRGEIGFVAFAGWDAAGARTFGFPTYWANRLGGAVEELGVGPDAAGPDLAGVEAFLESR
jgi:2-haloacid dehalogenase